jgi:hypothetical protein
MHISTPFLPTMWGLIATQMKDPLLEQNVDLKDKHLYVERGNFFDFNTISLSSTNNIALLVRASRIHTAFFFEIRTSMYCLCFYLE